MRIEKGPKGEGIQLIRTVIDCVQHCNLRCEYCHPGLVWVKSTLPANIIKDLFLAAEENGLLEVTLTGGEIMLHPQLTEILNNTHLLDRTVATLITNATLISSDVVKKLADSNLGRICISLDGPDPTSHNTARGATYERAVAGLEMLVETGKPITVISVAHHENYKTLIELSEKLARTSAVTQHHMCAPSYSGEARRNYERLRLREEEYHELQSIIDERFQGFCAQGLYVTFNSYWPATGYRSTVDKGRQLTLVQLTEQLKDCYVIVRSDGDFRLTAAAWGRETVGDAVIGNLHNERADELFHKADLAYRSGAVLQLPRAVEAQHKFWIGTSDTRGELTDRILSAKKISHEMISMIPICPLSSSEILKRPLRENTLVDLSKDISASPKQYRLIKGPSGVHVLFDKVTTHVTLLHENEALSILNHCSITAASVGSANDLPSIRL